MNPKKLGFRVVNIDFSIYGTEIHCLVGPVKNLATYVRWVTDDPDWEAPTCAGLTVIRPDKSLIIWLPRKPRTAYEYGALAHEMFHAVRAIITDRVGIPLSKSTDEAYCYALSYGVSTLLEGLR